MNGDYKPNSITLTGAVSMGTGVMIGAGIFALTGQVAELAGPWFPVSFLIGAIVSGFSAYSYVKLAGAFPSAGGIAVFLKMAYGPGVITASGAMLMTLSMVINESLVARTFGTYTLQLFNVGADSVLVPVLAVGLIIFAFVVNLSGNRAVGVFSFLMALAKVGGIIVLALAVFWATGFSLPKAAPGAEGTALGGFIASIALSILAYKGFTTIANSGAELVNPNKNVGRAIIISLAICAIIYMLVALAVGSNLTIGEIIAARDFSLAAAAKPALGEAGVWFTVALAIVATASGLLASVFAVSRMLAMLTDMKLIPHRHFGMPGHIQTHTLVYTVVAASVLAVFFDLGRIASLGAIFYLLMDMAVHWGVYSRLRQKIKANGAILLTAIGLDLVVLGTFLTIKANSDPTIIVVTALGMAVVFGSEWLFIRRVRREQGDTPEGHGGH
jgi:amino acid transporter